jgi:S1-C subfamily serine protease
VFAYPLEEGVVVAGLVPNGPAEQSGLKEGDVMLSLNSEEVSTRKDLYRCLWQHSPGERIALEVMRENALRRVDVTCGDRADFYKHR